MSQGQFTERYLQSIDQHQPEQKQELDKHKLLQHQGISDIRSQLTQLPNTLDAQLMNIRNQLAKLPETIDAYTSSQLNNMTLTTQQHQHDLTELREHVQQLPSLVIAQLQQHMATQQPTQQPQHCDEKPAHPPGIDKS